MTAPNTNMMIEKQRKRRLVLDKIYERFTMGVEVRNVSTTVFQSNQVSESGAKDYVRDLAGIGILVRRMEYGTPKNGMTPGRHFHWTVLVPKDEALARLDRLDVEESEAYERRYKGASKKAAETKRKNREAAAKTDQTVVRIVRDVPVEAISGPDAPNPLATLAPLRKNEAYALVEAARQYKSRTSTIDSKIADLLAQARELGMTVDEEALRGSVSLGDVDERLESVALILPYITELEQRIDRLVRDLSELREQNRRGNQALNDVVALRAQNNRLIAKLAAKPN